MIKRSVFLGGILFFILIGLYWLTYRGLAFSKDELFIFDSIESLARRGRFERTYEFDQVRPKDVPHVGSQESPWLASDVTSSCRWSRK